MVTMVNSIGGRYYNYSPDLFTNSTFNNNTLPITFNKPKFDSLFNLNPSVADTGNTIRDYDRLSREAAKLTKAEQGNVFNTRSVDTGNSTTLSATATDGSIIGTAHSIEVSQVAKAQENAGSWMDSNAVTNLSGEAGLQIKDAKGTVAKTVNTTVDAGLTNRQALEKLASSLNSDVVKAKVETKTIDGVQKSRLVVTSAKTGTEVPLA